MRESVTCERGSGGESEGVREEGRERGESELWKGAATVMLLLLLLVTCHCRWEAKR